jgi:hypothetical protein
MGIYIVLFIILQKQVCLQVSFLPGDSLLLAGIYNRINRKCAFIVVFVNVLILSTSQYLVFKEI